VSLEQAFLDDCPYAPEAVLLDELLGVDVATGTVVARLAVHDDLPLTRWQRVHPVKHPRHVNGALMVHLTGVLGLCHAYYVLGLRHAEGWIGYGARIHEARFLELAVPPEPMVLTCQATKVRRMRASIVARYQFRFVQAGRSVYEGDQTAVWTRPDLRDASEA
jgi:hypothetical protein